MQISEKNTELFTALRPGDIAIDCGANRGVITEILAKTGATVYAFEPNPYVFAELQKRVALYSNVTCIPKGIWIANTQKNLFLHEHAHQDQVHWSGGSSLIDGKENVNKEHFLTVDVIDFVTFLQSLPHEIAFIKMDIEGAEVDVLEKILDSGIEKRIGRMVVETHEQKIPMLAERTNILRTRIMHASLTDRITLNWI